MTPFHFLSQLTVKLTYHSGLKSKISPKEDDFATKKLKTQD